MKKPYLQCFLFLALFIFLTVQVFAQQEKSFKWSMALQNFKTGESIPFDAPIQSLTGEQFRLIVKVSAKSFLYVIAESHDGEDIEVLCSKQMKNGEIWQSEVMVLTEPHGTEFLFIIASLTEQKNLTQRVNALEKNYNNINKRALITEMNSIRSNISRFRESPEKPLIIGGSSRGNREKNQGVEFSGLGTYFKTISIEHR